MTEKQATRDAYGKALAALGQENKQIVVLDADLSKSTKTADFQKVCPERFFNAGIAEQNMLGVAAGLAAAGKRPVVSSFAVFATGRAFEQIRNSIAYPKLPVVIAATHAGVTVGEDGGSHQAIEDIAIMRALPNMTVLVPADGPQTQAALKAALDYDGPVYLRLGRLAVPTVYEEGETFTIGKGKILREGKDVALISCGLMTAVALEAAELLAAEGIAATVCDMASVKPIDRQLIYSLAAGCGCVVTAEEHNIMGGLGGAVAEVLGECCPVPLERVGLNDVFGQSGKPQELLEEYGLTAANIAAKAKKAISRK